MPNQIDRDVYVTRDVLKTPIQYVRGTDYLPIVMHFRDFNIPEDASAQVFIAKPSGNIFYGAATISGNDVTIATEEQMFIELGLTLMQISIQDNNKELISFAQPVYVSQNLKSGDLPDSTTDIKFLDQAIQEANEAVDTATTAAQQAAIAVQNANQAIQNANGLISELNEQVSSLNTNYASLVNGVSIPQLNTTSKTVVGALNELNSKTDFLFETVSDFTSRIVNLSNGRTYTCYCAGAFIALITNGASSETARGIFSKNSNGTTDFLVLTMGNSNIIYSARLNNTGEGLTYNKTFSDDVTLASSLSDIYYLEYTTDILLSAEQLGNSRIRSYRLSGSGYTGSLPAGSYAYGTAIVLKRSLTSLSVIVFPESRYVPIINHRVSSGWLGWTDFAGNSVS